MQSDKLMAAPEQPFSRSGISDNHHTDENSINLLNHDQLLQLFDFEKNPGVNPTRLSISGEVFWRCSQDPRHEIVASLSDFFNNQICAKCRARSYVDLKLYPKLLQEFDREANLERNPSMLRWRDLIDWRCDKGSDHVWTATVYERVIRGDGCFLLFWASTLHQQ